MPLAPARRVEAEERPLVLGFRTRMEVWGEIMERGGDRSSLTGEMAEALSISRMQGRGDRGELFGIPEA